MRWKIYYTDGSTYSDADGPWWAAPGLDVQVIARVDADVGRHLVARKERYWWDDKRQTWFGGDESGRILNDLQPGPTRTLYGRYVYNCEYEAAIKAAMADPYLPEKTARQPEEDF